MKVTVKDNYLNVRVGKPSVNAPCYQYLAPGSELEVDGEIYKGDLYGTIDTWMKDAAGNYYWSGGVSKPISSQISFNYTDFVKNDNNDWLNTNGQGVNVVIIDTGIILNEIYFNRSHIKEINLADNNNDLYHGNFICGIIGGIGPIYGVSNKAEIISIKYHTNTFNEVKDRINNLITSLQTVIAYNQPTVINLSQGFYDFQLKDFSQEKEMIINLFETLVSKNNVIIVCAAGDNKDIGDRVFPASLEQSISIGTIDNYHRTMEIANKLDVLTPMIKHPSYNNKFEIINDYGSSFSAAIFSGLIASFISSKIQADFTKKDILNELRRGSIPRNNFIFNDSTKFQYNIL